MDGTFARRAWILVAELNQSPLIVAGISASISANAARSTALGKHRKRRPHGPDEGRYICPSCGEQVVIPLDATQGREQEYVEDCPVCCNPNIIHVELDPAWDEPRVWAEAE